MGYVKSPKFLREQVEHTFNISDMLLKRSLLIHHSENMVLREADAL